LFSRFSPASKRVLRAAEQECRNRNHYYVGVEHLLIALVEEHDCAIEAHLADLGIRPGDVHAELRQALVTGEDRAWDGTLVTPRARAVVEQAEKMAADVPVEPIHLLRAIIEEDAGLAAEILRSCGQKREAAG